MEVQMRVASVIGIRSSAIPSVQFFSALGFLAMFRQRHAYRAQLARLLALGPHLIADTGLGVEQARREIAKPFWKA
jgi:uncharacterized protein YjiS (DUF1127 family)